MEFCKSKKFIFLLAGILAYKLIFNFFTGQIILDTVSRTLLNGELQADVSRFSLFYGFIFENTTLRRNPPNVPSTVGYVGSPNGAIHNHISDTSHKQEWIGDEKPTPFFSASRIALTYNLPMFLLGRFRFPDVSIQEPRVFLQERQGVWNTPHFLDSKPSPEDTDDSPKEGGDSNVLSVYLPISLYLNFSIQDLSCHIVRENSGNPSEVKIENFHTTLVLDTHRFRSIPLNQEAVRILDTFQLGINRNKPIHILYREGNANIETPLDLTLTLDKETPTQSHAHRTTGEEFHLTLNIGGEKIPITVGPSQNLELNFRLLMDSIMNPQEEIFQIRNFHILFEGQKWVDISLQAKSLFSPEPHIHLEAKPTTINLLALRPFLKAIPASKSMDFDGKIHIDALEADGHTQDLKIQGKLSGRGIRAVLPGSIHSVPNLDLGFFANFNLGDEAEPTQNNLIPILRSLSIPPSRIEYNGMVVNIHANLQPQSIVDFNLTLRNLHLQKFTPEAMGNVSLGITARGDNLSRFQLDLQAGITGLRYKMGKSLSGIQKLNLKIQKEFSLENDFSPEKISIPKIVLELRNEKSENFLSLNSDLSLGFSPAIRASIADLKLKMNLTRMIPSLPLSLKQTVIGLRSSLGDDLDLGGNLAFHKDLPGNQKIQLGLTGKLPAIELTDLHLGADLSLAANKEKTIQIHSLHIDAFRDALRGDFSGKFYHPHEQRPAFGNLTGILNGKLRLSSPTPRYILKGISFQGILDFDLNLRHNTIAGKLHTEKTHLRYEKGNCPGVECKFYDIRGLELDIPFEHDLFRNEKIVLTSGRKDKLIYNYGLQKHSNLRITSITGSHPTISGQVLPYIYPIEDRPGLSANLEYLENVLRMNDLNVFLLDGNISGKDILLNLNSTDPKDMEAMAFFRIRDIDLKKLLPTESQEKIDDGKIKADLNLYLKDLSAPIGNMNLFFSIHQIGKDFGTSAVNIVSPTNLITDTIIRSYSVNRVEFELNKGLVYAEILFNRSLLNRTIFSLEDDRIKEERIPLSKFLNQARGELSNYR